MLSYESIPLFASLISSISRAGLNVVDRRQFRNITTCPVVLSYWNNFLPVVIFSPLVLFSPSASYVAEDFLAIDVVMLAILIQLVAYSFGYAFKLLRVTDVAILSKSADITVPIFLSFAGVYAVHHEVVFILPAILCLFILSAGVNTVKISAWASLALVSMLSVQGIYSYFAGFSSSLSKGVWGLISFTFVVLIWRLFFSFVIMVSKERIFGAFKFPKDIFTLKGFYIRGILTVITQISFLLAISSNEILLIWPILNTTGFIGAIFAYVFLGERLNIKDFIFIFLTFILTCFVIFLLNYEKY